MLAAENSVDNYATVLARWLDVRRSAFGMRSALRIERLWRAFGCGEYADLSKPLTLFISWLRSNDVIIDAVLLWGSQLQALDSSTSFCRSKASFGVDATVLCGPSDIDALISVRTSVAAPSLRLPYVALDSSLIPVGTIELDLFRDVFIVHADELDSFLQSRSPHYLSCYLFSYYVGGLVLKKSRQFEAIFDRFAANRPFVTEARRYYDERQRRNEAILRSITA